MRVAGLHSLLATLFVPRANSRRMAVTFTATAQPLSESFRCAGVVPG